jgi:hypothetical protein
MDVDGVCGIKFGTFDECGKLVIPIVPRKRIA